ncbi:MAG TPA: alpha/beta hydrolase [Acidimicrobiales bacterium]|nr:alpha/beta hydrolase [Acidimicrobiales bacterium]
MDRRSARALVALGLCTALGGCAASGALPSTTTTTTLPKPVQVAGPPSLAAAAALGPIERVRVRPVPGGRALPPELPPGALATDVVKIGFRQVGSGPDLVLVMGEHGSMTWWDPKLVADLASHFTVTLFDLPGVGYSSAGGRPLDVAREADVTAGLIDALGLTRPVVLGWGLGGTIALALALRHRALVSRLVLADAFAGGPGDVPPSPRVTAWLASPTATTTALSRLFFPPGADGARLAWLGRLGELPPDDVVAQAVTAEAALARTAFGSDAIARRLGTLTLPVLVVCGALDEVVPSADCRGLAGAIPGAHLVVYRDAGYAALAQDEPAFVRELVAFAEP